jgi:hypothetical protein
LFYNQRIVTSREAFSTLYHFKNFFRAFILIQFDGLMVGWNLISKAAQMLTVTLVWHHEILTFGRHTSILVQIRSLYLIIFDLIPFLTRNGNQFLFVYGNNILMMLYHLSIIYRVDNGADIFKYFVIIDDQLNCFGIHFFQNSVHVSIDFCFASLKTVFEMMSVI